MLTPIVTAAEAALRVAAQYPEEEVKMIFTTTSPQNISVDTASGAFSYTLEGAEALRASLLDAFPYRSVEPIPNTWTSLPSHTGDALALLGHAVHYIRENPDQALMLSVSSVAITLMTTDTDAAFSVTLTPTTAAAHLQASEADHENAFSYLQHAKHHA